MSNIIENFLQQSVNQIRKSIRDIDDSYNHEWDIVAELCQNSIDAIKKQKPENGVIDLKIDALNKTISIKDNGIGISPERLPNLLAPFSTDKEDEEDSIGEKGVGLTFVIFSCNDFRIKSGTSAGTATAEIVDAFNWKTRSDDSNLPLNIDYPDEIFQGTEIELRQVQNCPIFDLDFHQLVHILRTKTALGNTLGIWEDAVDLSIYIQHLDRNGKNNQAQLKPKYWLPTEDLDNSSTIALSTFIDFAKEAHRDDSEKRKKLRDKIVYDIGEFDHGGRLIKYYACLVPRRRVWDDLTILHSLATEDKLNDDEWMDKYYYATFQNGIYTSVKGMPTGISVDHPITGAQGAWAQIFILFEDRYLKFDIGRKSIHGSQARIYKNYSRRIFSEFRKLAKYISGDIIIEKDWDKDEIFEEIDILIDLKSEKSKFLKTPKDQEASVAGIFYELIGSGLIRDIKPLVSGYRNKYDLYAKWGAKKIVVEFKSHLANVLKDFSDETKMFNEIDVLVCWDVTENDRQALKNRNIEIEEIQSSLFGGKEKFPNATHQLILSGLIPPIYVIDLKKLIE